MKRTIEYDTNHQYRSSCYAKIIVDSLLVSGQMEYRVEANYADKIIGAMRLHDIGKSLVPENILMKPGSLTASEFERVKLHVSQGVLVVEALLKDYTRDKIMRNIAIEIVRLHHEKWDGTGYQEGLSGLNIPLSARVAALSDVYDALTSERSYKDAMPPEDAREIILSGCGRHFDPFIVSIFVDKFEKFKEILTLKNNERVHLDCESSFIENLNNRDRLVDLTKKEGVGLACI